MRIRNDLDIPYNATLMDKWVDRILKESRYELYKKTFTMSFCNEQDGIPMWNYYSDKLGIAIGFNIGRLIEKVREILGGHYAITPIDIKYDEREHREYIKTSLIGLLKIPTNPDGLTDSEKKEMDMRRLAFCEMQIALKMVASHMRMNLELSFASLINKRTIHMIDSIS